jgi:hypothetical protein
MEFVSSEEWSLSDDFTFYQTAAMPPESMKLGAPK